MAEDGQPAAPSEGPPPLPYSLRNRKKSIAFFWTIFCIDTLVQPLVLYYALWYGTDLSHNLGMWDLSRLRWRPLCHIADPWLFSLLDQYGRAGRGVGVRVLLQVLQSVQT